MSTPPATKVRPGERPPAAGPEDDAGSGLQVWILRIASALVLPMLLIGFFFAFDFLRDENANKALQVIVAVVVGVGGIWGMYWGMDQLINRLPEKKGRAVRPFVFVGPAMVILTFYLVYPAINTVVISFQGKRSEAFVGLDNYARIFTESTYQVAILNSLGWVIFVPAVAVGIGLAFATMVDKLGTRTESYISMTKHCQHLQLFTTMQEPVEPKPNFPCYMPSSYSAF